MDRTSTDGDNTHQQTTFIKVETISKNEFIRLQFDWKQKQTVE